MTKKKAPSLLEKKNTPEIPHNSGGRRQAWEGGLIMGWMNNCKRGSPLKITPTNNKMKGSGKAPTKAAAASTAATKLPPKTAGRKYTNWKQEPAKYILACAVEGKLKGLDPQLAAEVIIIPDGTLRDHVRYTKD